MRLMAGSMLVVPAGVHKDEARNKVSHVAYVYACGQWGAPVMQLPAPSKARPFVPDACVVRDVSHCLTGASGGARKGF